MNFNKIMQFDLSEGGIDRDSAGELFAMMTDYFQLQQLYNAGIKEIRTKLEILDEEFRVKFDHNPIHHMEYRLKSPKSIIEKLTRKGCEISTESICQNLTDVAGVRVICNYVQDIYQIADLLLKQDDITLIRIKDYIKQPKPNGYRSLHLVVQVPIFLSSGTKPVNVEIQIRTMAMDFWASLEHQLRYKATGPVSEDLKTRLFDCAEQAEDLDKKMQSIFRELNAGEENGGPRFS